MGSRGSWLMFRLLDVLRRGNGRCICRQSGVSMDRPYFEDNGDPVHSAASRGVSVRDKVMYSIRGRVAAHSVAYSSGDDSKGLVEGDPANITLVRVAVLCVRRPVRGEGICYFGAGIST